MNNLKVLFLGPIAQRKKVAHGGFELANRRTIDLLEEKGIDVIELAYPKADGLIKKLLLYPMQYVLIYMRIIFYLATYFDKDCICHITPLYNKFIFTELLTITLCRILKGKIFLDIRAGSFIIYYNSRSAIYKKSIHYLLKKADSIAIEGLEYDFFIQEVCRSKPYYFPNYVCHTARPASVNARKSKIKDSILLVYFGRIKEEKGVEKCIETVNILKEKGYNGVLHIIGPVESAYKTKLSEIANGEVIFHGAMLQEDLFSSITNCHFFIFPTFHVGEGHSNALTEAMGHGCVPICSNNGFNKSVVGNCGVVLKNKDDASVYANAIINIIANGTWANLSEKCIDRVRSTFYSEIIIDNLIAQYLLLQTNE